MATTNNVGTTIGKSFDYQQIQQQHQYQQQLQNIEEAATIGQQQNLEATDQNFLDVNEEYYMKTNSQYSQGGDLQQQQLELLQKQQEQQQEEDLKKKIALYYHSLFQSCLGQWFVLMQQNSYSKLSKRQYIELNVRIQKSLILDFELGSAQDSALEDWKIDIEREIVDKEQWDKKKGRTIPKKGKQEGGENEILSNGESDGTKQNKDPTVTDLIDFERLSEFFFDLCLSWCQYLDIETFLYFLNGIFLNITKGAHVNVSVFKELEDIEVLSIEFFNQLLSFRGVCENRIERGENYSQWYGRNFGRNGEVVRNVEKYLQEAFKEKGGENRILDLWIDLPQQQENSYMNQHFDKLDKDLKLMHKASKNMGMLASSITMMDQLRKQNPYDKNPKKTQQQKGGDDSESQQQQQYIILTNTAGDQTGKITKKGKLKLINDRATKQVELEQQMMGQLGDRFKNAKLLEITENSYLIQNSVRLPIFGKSYSLLERTKSSISKRAFLLKFHPEYTNKAKRYLFTKSRELESKGQLIQSDILNSNNNNNNSLLLGGVMSSGNQSYKNVVYEKVNHLHVDHPLSHQYHQQQLQNLNSKSPNNIQSSMRTQQQTISNMRKDSIGKETLESESDVQTAAMLNAASSYNDAVRQMHPSHLNQQLMDDMKNISVKVNYQQDKNNSSLWRQEQNIYKDDSSGIIMNSGGIQGGIYNQGGAEELLAEQVQPSKSPNQVDEKALKQIYDRYIQLLAEDKNAKIENILKDEEIKRQFSGKLDKREIEAAVLERLYQEEENQEVQDMIAKFYTKFDDLHQQSIGQALARSPNKLQVKNEVKYKIPERWTGKFHKHDIVPLNIFKDHAVKEERGKVNKHSIIEVSMQQKEQWLSKNKQQLQTKPFNQAQQYLALQSEKGILGGGQDLQKGILNISQNVATGVSGIEGLQQMPLSNTMLKESLSSRATPKSEYGFKQAQNRQLKKKTMQAPFQEMEGIRSGIAGGNTEKNNSYIKQTKVEGDEEKNYASSILGNGRKVVGGFGTDQNKEEIGLKYQLQGDELLDSTDVSKAGDLTRQDSNIQSSGQCVPKKYDWSELAHLFENGEVPEEILSITDPIEYNYLLVRLKKDFNDKNKSEYMKYMNLQLPYHSRRDEVGGRISNEEWGAFVDRLEGIIERVKRKRRRIIKRRKKKGVKKLPRKTIFKPVKKPNLANDPLWKEVFLENSSDEEDEDDELNQDLNLNKQSKKVISSATMKQREGRENDIYALGLNEKGFGTQHSTKLVNQSRLDSAKNYNYQVSTQNKTIGGRSQSKPQNLDLSIEELSLPPIMRPLLYEDFKNQQIGRGKSRDGIKLRNAEMNLKEAIDKYPETKKMLNIKYTEAYYDPFEKEPHQPSRKIAPEAHMVKKIEHNYSKRVRDSIKQLNKTNI